MMKHLIITLIAFCLAATCFSQKSIHGKVIDKYGQPLGYTTVALLNPVDSTLMFFGVTNAKGVYQIKNIKEGSYIMQFSFVGMETSYKNITVLPGSPGDFGKKVMYEEVQGLGRVEVVAEYVPITFKSDTVEYNAKAFETKPDAVAEDLLKKIPGVEVDEAGNIKALGEDVDKVLVDGKEFFGKDLKVATKNLPAKAIDKVQVFDKKSEEAEFMGIDDGVRDRTINLLLNKEHKKGYFGNIEAGGGTDGYYKTETKLYRFSTKLQAAVLGMYNNINEFGYSSKGHDQWGQKVNGENTTLAGGLNLSYNISDKRRYFCSYLASSTDKILTQQTTTENFLSDGSYFQEVDLLEDENTFPHIINLGIRHQFNTNSKFTLDGDVDMSMNDIKQTLLTNTKSNDNLINRLENTTNNNTGITNASAKAVYIFKFNKKKTQVKTNMSVLYDRNISKLDLENLTTIINPLSVDFVGQYQNNNTEKLNLSMNPTLVQQIKPLWHLSINAKMGTDNEMLARSFGAIDKQIDSLSGDFRTERSYMQPAISLRRGSGKSQFRITIGAGYDEFEKINIDKTNDSSFTLADSYLYFLPGFSYENNYRKGRRFKIRYSSGINMPSVNQLLPVMNTVNPISMYIGNINLTPEYNHNMHVMWSIFDQFSFTSLFIRVGAGYTQNKISFSQTVTNDFVQIITPQNVRYNNSANGFVYFSTPYRPLRIKFNVRGSETINKGISVINSKDNINKSFTHSLKVSVENRVKKKWDINIGGSLSLTDSKFSIAENLNNIYYNTTYFSQVRFSPSKKWSFETEGSVINYSSKSFNESLNIPLFEAGITRFFMKSNTMSLTLKGYDLLNESTNIDQAANSNYLIQQQSSTIGRYVMLLFKMKIGK